MARVYGLTEALRLGRKKMLEPQDLSGRFGRVVKAVDRVLSAIGAQAVLACGWAVWRHGFEGRVTQDIDITIGINDVDEFLRVAPMSGFQSYQFSPDIGQKLFTGTQELKSTYWQKVLDRVPKLALLQQLFHLRSPWALKTSSFATSALQV
jgi:hypothetical protein